MINIKFKNYKKCPNCNENNIDIIADSNSYFINRCIFLIMLFLFATHTKYLENHIFITIMLIILLVSYVLIFFQSVIYMTCKNCNENFNFKFHFKNKDKDPDTKDTLSILYRASIFQMIFCGVISLIILTFISFYIPLSEHTKSIIYLLSAVVITPIYIIISTIDMEDWISRSTQLKQENVDFNKIYDSLAKLFGLLSTFYTLMYTKLSGNNYFDLNNYLYLNVILFTLSFSNFILEYITHKSNS